MSIFTVTPELLAEVSKTAKSSPRKRTNYNFHQLEDLVQRFLNAIEPESYIQPHRHLDPAKEELFFILKGKGAILEFDDEGKITKLLPLDPKKGQLVVEVPKGLWHTVVSLESSSVFLEVKEGPYDPTSDKDFAPWAPQEGEAQVTEYLQYLKDQAQELPYD